VGSTISDDMEGRSHMTTRGSDAPDYMEDEISLKPYFETLRGYRRVIGAAVVGVATLYLVSVLLVFLIAPAERLGSIEFRLLFEGAEKGEYPNGNLFSASEIVAGPVLTEVFKANDMQRFGKYEDFKDSVFVLNSNLELDLLAYDYTARLADTKLGPVERVRIEEEFRRKREAAVDPVYTISMLRRERLTTLPRDLMNKVLLDILSTWATQADERKGATRYNVDVLSPSILQRDTLDREEYLVAIDILRAKSSRVLATIDEIAKLPGAKTIRVGEERLSLADVRAGLEDVVRFKLEPLLGLIRSEGITKNPRALALYANNQLFQLRQEQQESAVRVQALQASVREFSAQGGLSAGDTRAGAAGSAAGTGGGAVTPQLDQSFLDRIMGLSTAKDDSEYKRRITDRVIVESEKMAARGREAAYYEDLAKELRASGSRAGESPEMVALIKSRSIEAFNEIVKAIEQTATIYREISTLNLNPSTTLFTVTEPFTEHTKRSLTARTITLYFVLFVMLTMIVVSIGCLIHHAFRKHSSAGLAS
jgi:hypothetical protein